MKRARVLLADDHSIILTGIRSLLERDCDLVGEVNDGRSLVETTLRLRPDLIILDVGMPLLNGIDAAKHIRKEWPAAKLLFLSMHANAIYLREAMNAGASGYLLKTSAAEELLPAVERVLKGQIYVSRAFDQDVVDTLRTSRGKRSRSAAQLTDRQREVLQLIAEGRGSKEIALVLNISLKTVDFHRGQIMRKLGVHTAVELTAFAVREGLVGE
jgi:DNA-binding NarL/FixJ family response regulator